MPGEGLIQLWWRESLTAAKEALLWLACWKLSIATYACWTSCKGGVKTPPKTCEFLLSHISRATVSAIINSPPSSLSISCCSMIKPSHSRIDSFWILLQHSCHTAFEDRQLHKMWHTNSGYTWHKGQRGSWAICFLKRFSLVGSRFWHTFHTKFFTTAGSRQGPNRFPKSTHVQVVWAFTMLLLSPLLFHMVSTFDRKKSMLGPYPHQSIQVS